MIPSPIPKHVAIIPDGNRRWAKEKGLPVFEGHRRGAENFIELSKKAYRMGVTVFTLWAFSTENWKRTNEEVGGLMKLFDYMLDTQIQIIIKEKIRIIHLGRKDRLGSVFADKIHQVQEKTKHFDQHYLVFALDYGGRDEIIRAISKMSNDQYPMANIQEKDFNMYLDTKDLPYPEPDLIIRTSGEQRTSGFMPWQSVYAEYAFEKKHFPDFTSADLEKAVHDYSLRQRRFGT